MRTAPSRLRENNAVRVLERSRDFLLIDARYRRKHRPDVFSNTEENLLKKYVSKLLQVFAELKIEYGEMERRLCDGGKFIRVLRSTIFSVVTCNAVY